ncbi:uncharacterized protein VTP21DRAFT_1856 [Calcarisporiella thermophila]|uniref:uncharacterized protein n=1 Tax=Calcarisporiella thermophila TaxID=911321 RepID=UPI003744757B
MKFRQKLITNQVPEWSHHYIGYDKLKKSIAVLHASRSNNQNLEIATFLRTLDHEIHRVAAFYDDKQSELERRLRAFCSTEINCPDEWLLDKALEQLKDEIYKLSDYGVLNKRGFERIWEDVRAKFQNAGVENLDSLEKNFSQLSFVVHSSERGGLAARFLPLIIRARESIRTLRADRWAKNLSFSLEDLHVLWKHLEKDDANRLGQLCLSFTDVENGANRKQALLNTLLYFACRYYSINCLSFLLEQGARATDPLCIDGRSLIHLLLIHGDKFVLRNGSAPSNSLSNSPHSSLIYLLSLLLDRSDCTSSADLFHRLPLHYAVINGYPNAVKLLLEHELKLLGNFKTTSEWHDSNGCTPLFYATQAGDLESLRYLIEIGSIQNVDASENVLIPKILSNSDELNGLPPHHSKPTLLSLACKYGHVDIVQFLVKYGADPIISVDEEGHSPLHIAVQKDSAEIVKTLLMATNKLGPNELEKRERIMGWTPLFLGAIEGHMEMVELLLKAGANPNTVDKIGLTPRDHAIYHGHILLAKLLPLTSMPLEKKSALHNTRAPLPQILPRNQCMIAVTFGSNNCNIPFVQLYRPARPVNIQVSFSAKDVHIRRILNLVDPEPMVIMVERENEKLVLHFDISSIGKDDNEVRGYARANIRIGDEMALLDPALSAPIIDSQSLDEIGKINFEILVARPFLDQEISPQGASWENEKTIIIGHRGLGMNRRVSGSTNLQLGENTLLSFETAASLGAEYVEFDVQVTRDLVPVIYHDWIVSETGVDVPMHCVTLDQFLALRPSNKTHHDHLGCITPHDPAQAQPKHPRPHAVRRSSSLDAMRSPVPDNTRLTRAFQLGKLKGNNPNTIHAPFTTLARALTSLPPGVGFNIEVKYPMRDEALQESLHTHLNLNTFLDVILMCVAQHANKRRIIFSSFHPETCILLRQKQSAYPVLFLTDAGVERMVDSRCNSLCDAVEFACQARLDGIVSASEPIIMAPRLVQKVHEQGLLLFTYGTLNNDAENAKLQRDFGVDAVIVDSVVAIHNSLKS